MLVDLSRGQLFVFFPFSLVDTCGFVGALYVEQCRVFPGRLSGGSLGIVERGV